jgi:hypothetical protein
MMLLLTGGVVGQDELAAVVTLDTADEVEEEEEGARDAEETWALVEFGMLV